MKSAKAFIEEDLRIKVPQGNISGEWFAKAGIPMVVRCTCCETTMVIFSALVDDDGSCYCHDCAGE